MDFPPSKSYKITEPKGALSIIRKNIYQWQRLKEQLWSTSNVARGVTSVFRSVL